MQEFLPGVVIFICIGNVPVRCYRLILLIFFSNNFTEYSAGALLMDGTALTCTDVILHTFN
jgi:hypothetical protein